MRALFGILFSVIGFGCLAQSVDGFGAIQIRQRILFDSSDSALDSVDLIVLNKVAALMNKRPNGLFEVTGHTDTTGTRAFNSRLGLVRAEMVQQKLIELGVPKKNLMASGRGEIEPLRIKGKYKAAKSRRVEFKQVLKISVKVQDAKTKRPISAELKLNFTSMPGAGVWKLDDPVSSHTWITPYRKRFIVQASKANYILDIDTLKPDLRKEGGSHLSTVLSLRPAVVKERINFDNIYFSTGRASITPESVDAITKLYELLNSKPDVYVEIRGHMNPPVVADRTPERMKDGKDLSLKRARAVYAEMVKRGINPARMTYKGMGGEEPRYPNPQSLEEGTLNQRVEILILQLK